MAKNILEMLKEDHQRVQKLFTDYESAGTESKDEIATQIFQELETHAQIEEQIFYPAVEESREEMAVLVAESLKDHQEAKDLIQDLRSMGRNEDTAEEFDDKMKILADSVREHIDEEENKLFPDARKNLEIEEFNMLGSEMKDMKESLETMSKRGSEE